MDPREPTPRVVRFGVFELDRRSGELRKDGVRVRLPHGWGLIRASNTQPALVLRFEDDSPGARDDYQRSFTAVLERIRGELE